MPDSTIAPPASAQRRRRYAVVAAAGALLVTVGAVAAVSGLRHREPTAHNPGPAMPSPAVPVTRPPGAAQRLHALADQLASAPGDHQSGRYDYLHSRTWMLTNTGRPAVRPMTNMVSARDDRRWITADGSGIVTAIEPAPDYRMAGAEPGFRSTDAEFTGRQAVTTVHPAGELAGSVPGTIPTDPVTLARALDAVDPTYTGADAPLLDVQNLYLHRYVPPPARAAVLRMLADVPGLTLHEPVVDRLGRTGIAVSLHTRPGTGTGLAAGRPQALRHLLVFDPRTGQLWAYEQRLTARDPDHGFPAGKVYLYNLYLTNGQTRGQPS